MKEPLDFIDVSQLRGLFIERYGPQCPIDDFTTKLRNHLRLLPAMTKAPKAEDSGPLHPRLNRVAEVCRTFYTVGDLYRIVPDIDTMSGHPIRYVRVANADFRCWGPDALGGTPSGATDIDRQHPTALLVREALGIALGGTAQSPSDIIGVMPREMRRRTLMCPLLRFTGDRFEAATSGTGLPTKTWWAYLNALHRGARSWAVGQRGLITAVYDGWHLAFRQEE